MKDNRIIKAENVYKAIEKQGYYYILAEKYYGEEYIGPKYIIATDDPDFKEKKPALADMIIVPVEKFLKMAEVINESILNDEREARRIIRHHNAEGYYEDLSDSEDEIRTPLKIKVLPLDPVADEVETRIKKEELIAIMDKLKEAPRRRLYLYYFEGLTYREIAIREKVGDKAVRQCIKIALRNLKTIYEQTPQNVSPSPSIVEGYEKSSSEAT